jgi:hypothetical protein
LILSNPSCDLLKLNYDYEYFEKDDIFKSSKKQCETKRGRTILRKLQTDRKTAEQC